MHYSVENLKSMLFKSLSGANTVSECLKDIEKRMNEWYERVAKIYYWLVDVVKYYKVVDLLDIFFLGVINTCTAYRRRNCFPSDTFCDDVYVNIIGLCDYKPGKYALHRDPGIIGALERIYKSAYESAKEISTSEIERIERERMFVVLGEFSIPNSNGFTRMFIYYPEQLLMRKFGLSASEISVDVNISSKRVKAVLRWCVLRYEKGTGLSVSEECSIALEPCGTVGALFGVVDSAVNLFERISREGVRVITTYLLY